MPAKATTSKPKPATRASSAKSPRRPASAQRSRPAPKSRASKPASTRPAALAGPTENAGTKQSQLINLLRNGATLVQMTQLTGWQPHTVRGTISGVFRKKLGLSVTHAPDEAGVRVYRIVEPA